MPMRVSRIEHGEPFAPDGHQGVGPVWLQGGAATPTDKVTVVLSHYLPGACAELSLQPAETIYVVTAGRLLFASDGVEVELSPMDSVHYTPGTARTVENRTRVPASMLVIRSVS